MMIKNTGLTNHSSLLMNQHSKILKNLIYFTNLVLNFFDPLLSFFNYGFIEYNLIIQKYDVLAAHNVMEP